MAEIGRRFSLDKVHVDPTLKNKIFSADGDEHIGNWNGGICRFFCNNQNHPILSNDFACASRTPRKLGTLWISGW